MDRFASIVGLVVCPSLLACISAFGQHAPHEAPTAPQEPAAPASESPSKPAAHAIRTDTPPTIDGVLDDDCWSSADPFENFTQVDPLEGAEPTERTQVRVLFDDENIYFAVRCFDSTPDKIIARQRQRDGDQSSDDAVNIVIDALGDKRSGYFFQMSAAGAKRDGLIDAFRGSDRVEWDGIWFGKTSIDEHGWSAELAIPFKTISFRTDLDAWGFNIQRVIRRKQETVRWATPTRNSNIRRVADAGTLDGLKGMSQGLGLTIKPSVSTRVDLDDGGVEIRPGLDLFYRLTPSTTAAITVNTDFAEAEVDERRVNLTRFPLFFPEKREFFLQDADVFSFGGIQSSPLPFFSRRIGIVRGEQRDILAGFKLTGREKNYSFGLLDVQMQDDDELGSKNLAVARVAANIFEQSTVGVIATNGDPANGGGNNSLGGADLNLRTTSFLGDQTLESHAWLMGTTTDDPDGEDPDDTAFGGRITYPNDTWSASLFAAHIGAGFNPALGFVERTGVREYNANLRRRWRTTGAIRRLDLSANPQGFTKMNGRLETLELTLPEVEIETAQGDIIEASYIWNQDVLDEDFEIADGVVIPEDDHSFGRWRLELLGSPSRVLSPGFEVEVGDFYEGRRTDLVPSIEWRPSPSFFGAVEYEINDIDLPGGDFTVRIARARASVYFTPEISWSNTIQYDNVSDTLGVNSRLRWEVTPGNDVFLVLNQGYEVEDDTFRSERSDFTVKVGVTLRF